MHDNQELVIWSQSAVANQLVFVEWCATIFWRGTQGFWLSAQGSPRERLREGPYGIQRINLGQPHARQVPYVLYYISANLRNAKTQVGLEGKLELESMDVPCLSLTFDWWLLY